MPAAAKPQQDWLTQELEQQNDVLIAESDWLARLYGVSTGAQFSLRLISDLDAHTDMPVLVIRHDNLRVMDETEGAHEALHRLRWEEFECVGKLFPVVLIRPSDVAGEQFGVYRGKLRRTRVCSAVELAQFLAAHDPEMIRGAGCGKALNKGSCKDAFQAFSRAWLARGLVVQDVDMLQKVGDSWRPIETKRARQAPAAWEPYCDDAPNYESLEQAARAFGFEPPICICYQPMQRGQVALLTVHRRLPGDELYGERALCSSGAVLSSRPSAPYVSRRGLR